MKCFSLICLSLILSTVVIGQPAKAIDNKDSYSWMFGTSWILTDDDGESFNPFLIENMHSHLFPSRFFVDKFIYNGWSAEAVLTYSVYNPNKLTNGQENISGSLFSMDLHSKYSFYKLLNSGAIDPFAFAGLGISVRDNQDTLARALSPTLNVGVGVNFWLSKHIGLQISSTAKVGVIDLFKSSNYMQHSLGLVVRFESLKRTDNSFNKSKYKIDKRRKKIKINGKKKGRKDT